MQVYMQEHWNRFAEEAFDQFQRTICVSGNIPASVLFRVGDDRCCSFLMATKFNLVEQSIAPKLFSGDDGK